MAKIIRINEHRQGVPPKEFNKCPPSEKDSFDVLLQKAHRLRKSAPKKSKKRIQILIDLKQLFEARINQQLFERKLIGSDFFLCSCYVSSLLANNGSFVPKSWYAVDYLLEGHEKNNPFILQDGANVCFLLCTLFPDRCNRLSMKIEDYASMGSGMFHRYYHQTGREIGYHMSIHFETMVNTTAMCMNDL